MGSKITKTSIENPTRSPEIEDFRKELEKIIDPNIASKWLGREGSDVFRCGIREIPEASLNRKVFRGLLKQTL